MSAYCDGCGEEPDFDLQMCYSCGKNLCESCFGSSTFDACRACRRRERQGLVLSDICVHCGKPRSAHCIFEPKEVPIGKATRPLKEGVVRGVVLR